MTFTDINDPEYRKALREFERMCSSVGGDIALGFCNENHKWVVLPYDEAQEKESIQVVLVCRQGERDENES